MQRRSKPTQDRGRHRDDHREREDGRVHLDDCLGRDHARRHQRDDQSQAEPRQPQAGSGRGRREDEALDEQLPQEPASTGAQRSAHGHFPFADRRPREQEVGHVAAGDPEQQQYRRKQPIERVPEIPDHGVEVRPDDGDGPIRKVPRRIRDGETLGDRVEIRGGRRCGDAPLQAPHERKPGSPLRPAHRHPEIGAVDLKPRRHDGDERRDRTVQPEGLADDRRVAAELVPPRPVVDREDGRRSGLRVCACERSSEERRNAQVVGRVAGDLGAAKDAGGRAILIKDRRGTPAAHHVFEHLGPGAERREFVKGKGRPSLPAANIGDAAQRDDDRAIDVSIRQRRDEQSVDDTEDHGRGADAERKRQHGRCRDTTRPAQRADRESKVLRDRLEHRHRAAGLVGSGETRTISFPKFDPSNSFRNAAGALSSPSTMSSRYLILPALSQAPQSRRKSPVRSA